MTEPTMTYRAVMNRSETTSSEGVSFVASHDDDETPLSVIRLDCGLYTDMGAPDVITVTVEPWDQLNDDLPADAVVPTPTADRPENPPIEPGACGDPDCNVLHADPANPIHPPSPFDHVPGDTFNVDGHADADQYLDTRDGRT